MPIRLKGVLLKLVLGHEQLRSLMNRYNETELVTFFIFVQSFSAKGQLFLSSL